MAGKKDALVPAVYSVVTTRRSSGGGTATLWKQLQYDEKPDRLDSGINWDGSDVASFEYASYELFEYFANGKEQAGTYVFYNAAGDMIASCSKGVVNVDSLAKAIDEA